MSEFFEALGLVSVKRLVQAYFYGDFLDTKKFLVSGIAAGVVILILSMVISSLTQIIFKYDMLSLAGMRIVSDPIMMLFFVYPFVLGFAMAYVYQQVKFSSGLQFGFLVWLVSGFTSAFMVFATMTYSLGFTVNSLVGSLIYMLAAGIVVAKLNESKK